VHVYARDWRTGRNSAGVIRPFDRARFIVVADARTSTRCGFPDDDDDDDDDASAYKPRPVISFAGTPLCPMLSLAYHASAAFNSK
jgi:hypothetical protein